jgi:hypothetical protein
VLGRRDGRDRVELEEAEPPYGREDAAGRAVEQLRPDGDAPGLLACDRAADAGTLRSRAGACVRDLRDRGGDVGRQTRRVVVRVAPPVEVDLALGEPVDVSPASASSCPQRRQRLADDAERGQGDDDVVRHPAAAAALAGVAANGSSSP